jgi:geranylgeranyl pyrophosphate synthase
VLVAYLREVRPISAASATLDDDRSPVSCSPGKRPVRVLRRATGPRRCSQGFRPGRAAADEPSAREPIAGGIGVELLHTMALIHDDLMTGRPAPRV